MSLYSCPACSNQVSTEATTCLKCGKPLKGPFSATRVIIVLALIAAGFGYYLKTQADERERNREENAKALRESQRALERARGY